MSSRVLVSLKSGGRTLSKEHSEHAISMNLLVIVIYVITIFVATIATLHLYITSFRPEVVVFEIVSALSNMGLSAGFISAASPIPGKMDIYPAYVAGEARDSNGDYHYTGYCT